MPESNATTTDEQTDAGAGVLQRPLFQLRSLPIAVRWEATRRHPHYQDWWRLARSRYLNEPVESEKELLLRQAAVAILGAIGVSDVPPDPATNFEQLEADELNPAWLSGAVHPITLRGIAGLLIAALPKESVGAVALALLEACRDDAEDKPPPKIKALNDLYLLNEPGLDSYPDEPIVSINPAASGRQVVDAVTQLLPQWKGERELAERRDRSGKHADYLRVWDLREGWHGGAYDRTQEMRFKEVAAELKLSIATAHNHYRRAFEMIVGHVYSPELWYRVIGPCKLSELYGQEPGSVSRRRPSKSKARREVPKTVLSPTKEGDDHSEDLMTLGAVASDDRGYFELISDIRRLLDKQRSDQEIVDELDLSEETLPAIAHLRQRGGELL